MEAATLGTTPADALLITANEAFRRIGVSRAHGYRLIKSGELPSVKIGRSRRVSVRALEAWVARIDGTAAA